MSDSFDLDALEDLLIKKKKKIEEKTPLLSALFALESKFTKQNIADQFNKGSIEF